MESLKRIVESLKKSQRIVESLKKSQRIVENLKKSQRIMENLKKWLLEQFANSVFKTDGQFPAMSVKPAHIHLKQEAVPKGKH